MAWGWGPGSYDIWPYPGGGVETDYGYEELLESLGWVMRYGVAMHAWGMGMRSSSYNQGAKRRWLGSGAEGLAGGLEKLQEGSAIFPSLFSSVFPALSGSTEVHSCL